MFHDKDNIVDPVTKGIVLIGVNALFALIALFALKQIRTNLQPPLL